VSFIDSLPPDKHALHDIRFKFKADNIWTTIATNHPELDQNDISRDTEGNTEMELSLFISTSNVPIATKLINQIASSVLNAGWC
jgi:hypothetical protein